jgi:membrane-associated protease RseP (regulator of RpoE activity)
VRESYTRVPRTSSQGYGVDLSAFLVAWRTTSLPDREVVDALVHPAHAGPSPALAAVLARRPGSHYWSDEPDGRHLILTRPLARRRERWALHLVLFLATLFTTTFVGAVFKGTIPFDPNPVALLTGTYPFPPNFLHAWASGLRFSLPLLAILFFHELGHYLTARRYQVDVSPPYFIPVPFVPWSIGTLGAFIRLRTVVADRRQLLDIGIGGPIAGLVVAVGVLWVGMHLSQVLPGHGAETGMLVAMGTDTVGVGDSILTLVLRQLTHGASTILLDPLAFAGWLGIVVTMYNLLPISQLDGGHILYAALPRWHSRVALAFWLFIIALGWYWGGWWLWGLLVLVLSRGRLGHPPVIDAQRPLPRSRRVLAWAALLLFLITFVPVPFRL